MKKFPRLPKTEIREMSAARMRALVAQRKQKAHPEEAKVVTTGRGSAQDIKENRLMPEFLAAAVASTSSIRTLRAWVIPGTEKECAMATERVRPGCSSACIGARAGNKYQTGSQSSYRLRGVAA
ncbi:hypothetical protein GmRootV213_57720 (plasmid) [Variovorax sp. V213]|uniref:hypothetical protein n=1 Tax=Variovorax sp. V213 TaxID=3065955 RepID=UPI0034E8D505